MKLVIKDNKVIATMTDESTAESKYDGCTFIIIPNGKYLMEKTFTNEEGNEYARMCNVDVGDPAPILDAEDTLANVRYKRSLEYPTYGDVIDALFKKEAGDATEWNAMAVKRQEVKTKYPKQ